MNKLFSRLIAASAVLISLIILVRMAIPDSFDPVRHERQILAIERARQLAPIETFAAGVLTLILPLAALIALGLLTTWGMIALMRFRHERHPDSRGLIPINMTQLEIVAPHALGAYHGTRQIEAARQPVPHSISYSPHESYAPRVDYRPEAAAAAEKPTILEQPAALPVPSFAQLLADRRIGYGNPLLLGYDHTGAPVEGTWLQLYSTAVGGLSGSGKTWTATFLATQAALLGARMVLLDPHAADPESLAQRLSPMRRRFVCEAASTIPQMRSAVDLVAAELERRKGGQRGEPWVVICDEFSAMQRGELADPLSKLIEGLGQEGRKLGIYAMVCGQVWNAARTGGSELRDSLASAYVHRLRPAQARMLTGIGVGDLPDDLLQLPAGTAYLLNTAGEFRRVTIPTMSADDITKVAQLLSPSTPTSRPTSPPRPIGFRPQRPEGATEGAKTEPLPTHQEAKKETENWTPEEAAIIAALKAGKTPGEVAAQIAGTSGGRKYQETARKIADVIRRALGKEG